LIAVILYCVFVLMLEWCYQWDNPEYVDKHYEHEKNENLWSEQISKALLGSLLKEKPIVGVAVDKNSEIHNQENSDPKDALYFVDL